MIFINSRILFHKATTFSPKGLASQSVRPPLIVSHDVCGENTAILFSIHDSDTLIYKKKMYSIENVI